jgi:hypothetical protein
MKNKIINKIGLLSAFYLIGIIITIIIGSIDYFFGTKLIQYNFFITSGIEAIKLLTILFIVDKLKIW